MKHHYMLISGLTLFACASAGAQERTATQVSKPDWALVSKMANTQGLTSSRDFKQSVERAKIAKRRSGDAGTKTDSKYKPEYSLISRFNDFEARAGSSDVPVLIPSSAINADAAALATGATYYDFTAIYPGDRFVSVMGMCKARRLPDGHPIHRVLKESEADLPTLAGLDTSYTVTEGEVGHELTFTKFGCSYKLSVSCEVGACASESDLVNLANDMAVINAR